MVDDPTSLLSVMKMNDNLQNGFERLEFPHLVKKMIQWSKNISKVDVIEMKEHRPHYTILLKKKGVPDLLIDVNPKNQQVIFYTCELTKYPLTKDVVPTKSPQLSWFLSEVLELQSRTRIAKIILMRDDEENKKTKNEYAMLRMHLSSTITLDGLSQKMFSTIVKEHFWLSAEVAQKIEKYHLPQSWRTIEKDFSRRFEVPLY